jgi:hypothetical protein
MRIADSGMNDLVKTLEDKYLDEFRERAKLLSSRFENLKINAGSHSVRMEADLGQVIFLSVMFVDAPLDQPDLVDLSIEIENLNSTPKINAGVCWGHPSGCIEAELYADWKTSEDWLAVTDDLLEQLYTEMPNLYRALENAVERRRPLE